MQAVFDVQVPARLLVPAEHQVVEVEEGEAVVSLTNRPNDIVRSPHSVNLKPSEGTRFDADVEDASLREFCLDCADESLEVNGDLFGDLLPMSLSAGNVVVSRGSIDDDVDVRGSCASAILKRRHTFPNGRLSVARGLMTPSAAPR